MIKVVALKLDILLWWLAFLIVMVMDAKCPNIQTCIHFSVSLTPFYLVLGGMKLERGDGVERPYKSNPCVLMFFFSCRSSHT